VRPDAVRQNIIIPNVIDEQPDP